MNRLGRLFLILALLLSGCAAPAVTQGALVPTATLRPEVTLATAIPSPSGTSAAQPAVTSTQAAGDLDAAKAYEMHSSFDFFWEQANTQPGSPGFGLIRDRYPGSEGIASMASVGFGLTAYTIGVEKGYISREQGAERAGKTLDTLLAMDRQEGFYYHFVDLATGKRAWDSEVSSIDTSILLMGVLSAGQYFGGEVQAKAKQIYDGVNWPWFLDTSKQMFYMAYRPEKGFEGHWDFYAEQLMMYVLAAGSDTHPVGETPYYTFTRHKAAYDGGQPFIHSWFGSLFTYQFSHAWIDFRGTTDKEGVDWFDNSVQASLAQYNFAKDVQGRYKTIGPDAWGLTACDGPDGYNGTYGAPPSGYNNDQHEVDDTVAPSAAIGSIIFTPQQSEQALLNYSSIDKLKGKYGFVDAYNLSREWYDTDVIGIDKGITLLMLANAENDFVHQVVMKNETIQNGLARLQITKK